MALKVNDSGTWKEAQEVHVNDGGAWKSADEVWVNDGGTWKQVFTSTSPGVWDVNNLQYSNTAQSLTGEFSNPRSIHFKDDGSKMYVSGNDSAVDKIVQYDLSTPWNIDTITFEKDYNVGLTPLGLHIGDNGNKLYWYESGNDQVHEENLSTAWDISTAGGTINTLTIPDSFSREVCLKPDGTVLWATGNQNDRIYQYNLSTPWDISTASSSGTLTITSNSAQGPVWKPDGTRFYLSDATNNEVAHYNVTTPWDVTTANSFPDQSISVSSQSSQPFGIFWKSDGSQLYLIGSNNGLVYMYDIV